MRSFPLRAKINLPPRHNSRRAWIERSNVPIALRTLCSKMGPSARPRMVRQQIRHAHRAARAGLAANPRSPQHANLRADRLRQDFGRISRLHRRPGPQSHRRRSARSDRSPLRLAAESPQQRHPEKSRRAARRNSATRPRARLSDAGNSHRRAHWRHAHARAPRDARSPAAHSRHHARIALHSCSPPRRAAKFCAPSRR